MKEQNSEKIILASEYICNVSKNTITPICKYKYEDCVVKMFYENFECKNKADNHGTTELMSEMFVKYLTDNGIAVNDIPKIEFDFLK